MPILGTLLASLFGGLTTFLARFFSLYVAQKAATYALYITVTTAFLASVFICVSYLYSQISVLVSGGGGTGGISWIKYFFMGVGMFIPANAGAVIACVGSVWIATGVYKIQKQGIANWGS